MTSSTTEGGRAPTSTGLVRQRSVQKSGLMTKPRKLGL